MLSVSFIELNVPQAQAKDDIVRMFNLHTFQIAASSGSAARTVPA